MNNTFTVSLQSCVSLSMITIFAQNLIIPLQYVYPGIKITIASQFSRVSPAHSHLFLQQIHPSLPLPLPDLPDAHTLSLQ